jgi:hypothetical protein
MVSMAPHRFSTLTSVFGRAARPIPPPEASDFAEVRATGPQDKKVSQAEIQQDVQRFAGDLMQRIGEGAGPLFGTKGETRRSTLQQVLIYGATVLDIATEPIPEVALLDMNVFLALSGDVLRRHWIPNVFGESGKPLLDAFESASDELRTINSRVLRPETQARLQRLIEDWERENRDRIRIESVRLYDFIEGGGTGSRQRASDAKGLLRDVRSSIKAVDEAFLLADRVMFLAQREPFLIRLQARLGVSEIVSDSLTDLSGMEGLLSRALDAQPLLAELSGVLEKSRALAIESRETARAAQGTLEALLPVLGRIPSQGDLQRTLGSVNQLVAGSSGLLNDLRATSDTQLRSIEQRFDRLLRRCVFYLAALGAVWALLFWGGYYAAKRLLGAHAASAEKALQEPKSSANNR